MRKKQTPGIWNVSAEGLPMGVKCRDSDQPGHAPLPLISTKAPAKPGDIWLAVNDDVAECKSGKNVWAFGRTEQEAMLNLGIAVAKKSFKACLKEQFRDWL